MGVGVRVYTVGKEVHTCRCLHLQRPHVCYHKCNLSVRT